MTTEINQQRLSQTIEFLKKAATINANTNNCVDVDLTGNWNQVEVRAYDSKNVPSSHNLLFESYDLHGDNYDDDEKIEAITIVLNNLLKSIPA